MSQGATAAVYVETYGCQMNVLDSQLVKDQLEALGYRFVDDPAAAGVVLLNTCSVRELSEQKVWSKLGRLGLDKVERPDLVVGVLGCMAEREGPALLRRMPHVDVLCGPSNLDQLPALLQNAVTNRGRQVALAGHTSRRSQTVDRAREDDLEALDLSRASPGSEAAQAYVRITRGCNKFCSFCVVPYTRGPEVHRPPQHLVEEVRRLRAAGVLEVTLLGQTVNHYVHHDGGRTTSFADLLWLIHESVPDLPRLRFLTSYPRDFSDQTLDVMAAAPRICRYLHVPAQSGSDRILAAMNRGYRVDEYRALLARARARMPDLRVAGDMIAGFPGETDADHQASLELLRWARYKSCFVFKYSPRPGTVAARRLADDVPEATKKERNLELLAAQAEISRAELARHAGSALEVLVEGFGKLRRDRPDSEGDGTAAAADVPPAPGPGPEAPVQLGWRRKGTGDRPAGWVRLRGRTEGDEIVAFDGPGGLVGTLTSVRAERATPLTILGAWLGDAAAET